MKVHVFLFPSRFPCSKGWMLLYIKPFNIFSAHLSMLSVRSLAANRLILLKVFVLQCALVFWPKFKMVLTYNIVPSF